jgi:hypothetical protein
MRKVVIGLLALSLISGAAMAAAKPNLREVKAIDDGLMAVAIADDLRKKCDNISPRLITAYNYLGQLKRIARDMGYSSAEIEAHVKSQAEKERMRTKAEAYLAAQGISRANTASYCAYGVQEIKNGSQIGALLRAK